MTGLFHTRTESDQYATSRHGNILGTVASHFESRWYINTVPAPSLSHTIGLQSTNQQNADPISKEKDKW